VSRRRLTAQLRGSQDRRGALERASGPAVGGIPARLTPASRAPSTVPKAGAHSSLRPWGTPAGEVVADSAIGEKLVALLTATLMTIEGGDGIAD
jgi:hypothetical protein